MDTFSSDTVDADNDPFGVIAGDSAPLKCEVCASPIEYGGRGRKPKFCDEHKRSNTGSNKSATVGKVASNSAVAKKIENSINGMGGMTAMLCMARKSPQDAQTIITKVPPFATAMGNWGAESKRIAKMVESGANGFAAITVIFTAFDLIWELLANHGITPAKKASQTMDGQQIIQFPNRAQEG